MGRQIPFDSETRAALRRGLDRLADAVGLTIGPSGRAVAMQTEDGAPTLTREGTAVARGIELADPVENLGAHLGREVSGRTQEMAGDGTSTAVVLAQSMVGLALEALEAGRRPQALKSGVERAAQAVLDRLRESSRPLSSAREVARVATLSAGGDEDLGQRVASAFEETGPAGVLSVIEGNSEHTRVHLEPGTQIPSGFLSVYFVNDPESMRVDLPGCRVLLHDGPLVAAEDVLPVLRLAIRDAFPLVVVASEFQDEALTALVVHKLQAGLDLCALQAPGYGPRQSESLEDLAALSGAKLFSAASGSPASGAVAGDLGRVGKLLVERDASTWIGDPSLRESLELHVRGLEARRSASGLARERDRLSERLGALRSAVGVLEMGGGSEEDVHLRRLRAEDAIAATRAAREEGLVPGGGLALLRAASTVGKLGLRGDEREGALLFAKALEAPARWLARNAGFDDEAVLREVRGRSGAEGFNVLTGACEDLDKAGIVDPMKVVRVGLQNATAVAAMIIITECLILEGP